MLTHDDLADAGAIWQERVGDAYDLDVVIVGEHSAGMDEDRPVGAILKAKLSVRLLIHGYGRVLFDESCPYSRDALLASVRALSAALIDR